MVSEIVCIFVWSHLSLWKDVRRDIDFCATIAKNLAANAGCVFAATEKGSSRPPGHPGWIVPYLAICTAYWPNTKDPAPAPQWLGRNFFPWETAFLLVEILQQPIKNFHFKVFKANTPNKMDHTMWKSIKKLCRKMVSEIVCIFVCGHLSLWKDVGGMILFSDFPPF